MWTTQKFLEEAIRKVAATVPEPASFAAQNTAYAIFIVLEALLGGDATLAAGHRLTIDAVTYDISAGLPASLIDEYGILGECEEAIDTELAAHGADLMVGFSVVPWGDELTRMETEFGAAAAVVTERDYYGNVEEAGGLSAELEDRARGLFTVAQAASEATAEDVTVVAEPEVGVAATATAAAATPSIRRQFARTRRTHGRRALTPIKSSRSTATTRRRH